jgi:hypothetical protein
MPAQRSDRRLRVRSPGAPPVPRSTAIAAIAMGLRKSIIFMTIFTIFG